VHDCSDFVALLTALPTLTAAVAAAVAEELVVLKEATVSA
jgi:hypothetical protein